jgi:hypothetical protein
MQVKIDDEIIFEIDEMMVKLLSHDLIDPINEIKRRLNYIIQHKCDECFKRIESEWMEKFRSDPSLESIPKSKKDFCEMVFKHKDYKNRQDREQNNKVK